MVGVRVSGYLRREDGLVADQLLHLRPGTAATQEQQAQRLERAGLPRERAVRERGDDGLREKERALQGKGKGKGIARHLVERLSPVTLA
jgi:hypothetical protein